MVNKYYQKRKEKLATVAREKYQILFEEEKNKRQKKARKRYQNFTEEEKRCQYYQERKKKLPQYRRNYY